MHKQWLNGLETSRLRFRRLKPSDFQAWLEYFNSQEALEFMGLEVGSRAACNHWIDKQLWRYEQNGLGLHALINKKSNMLVGQCGLLNQEVDGLPEFEIGYHLLPSAWGKGFASEAATAVRDFTFRNDLTTSIISIIHVDNTRSQKVALRNGMKKEKQTKFKEMPVFIFRIEREDWEPVR